MSNIGFLVTGVAAAWVMVQLTESRQLVALVQTALMLPFVFVAMPAGAIADSYDRRAVGVVALCAGLLAGVLLIFVTAADLLTPWLLLGLCFLVGSANTLLIPSWQTSAAEMVPDADLTSAVSLNAVSFNIARSFGPALGGLIVAAGGAVAAFVSSTAMTLPMLAAFGLWKRAREKPRLPPERIGGAIVAGVKYIGYSSALRSVVLRSFLYCAGASVIVALLPLIAKDQMGGGPVTFGILLGFYGAGAVIGGLLVQWLQPWLGKAPVENALTITALGVIALSQMTALWLAAIVLLLTGIIWTQALTSLNIIVQIGAPRWVAGRVLAGFQATAAGGFALGAALWGSVAQLASVPTALLSAGLVLLAFATLGRTFRSVDDIPTPSVRSEELVDPTVELAITGRSGPILLEVEYVVPEEDARQFYDAMLGLRRIRHRNGASGWALARDVANARRWVERFHLPTWHDYLRHRERLTAEELQAMTDVTLRYGPDGELRMTRWLERPVGSVRWGAETPDRGHEPKGLNF